MYLCLCEMQVNRAVETGRVTQAMACPVWEAGSILQSS